MTQENKQRVIEDVCARLPYGVIVEIVSDGGMMEAYYDMRLDAGTLADLLHSEDDFKPYLRPMSSMTKEEKYTYRHMLGATLNSEGESIMFVYVEDLPTVINWLLKNHFDFRGLIDDGLAIEAPANMYKTE